MNNKECPFCGYQWQSRVEMPKECPQCKRRFVLKELIDLYMKK